jgi:DNA-3-methyladenine glycosylase
MPKPGRIVPASFYNRDTELVSREMLGMLLQCNTPDGRTSGVIVETEAYLGEHDLACHAAAGRTVRTAPLYERPGIAYVYFIYGTYWCFNAVTRAEGLPSAVLVRAVEPVEGLDLMRRRRPRARRDRDLTNGPGKLCLAMGIDGSMNRLSLQRGSLVIREYMSYPDSAIAVTPRIGITRSADWPLRWIVSGNDYISKA